MLMTTLALKFQVKKEAIFPFFVTAPAGGLSSLPTFITPQAQGAMALKIAAKLYTLLYTPLAENARFQGVLHRLPVSVSSLFFKG